MDATQTAWQLLSEIHKHLENPYSETATALRKTARLCRLTKDYRNLLWIELELAGMEDQPSKNAIYAEVINAIGDEEFKKLHAFESEKGIKMRLGPNFVKERGAGPDANTVLGFSVSQMEQRLTRIREEHTDLRNRIDHFELGDPRRTDIVKSRVIIDEYTYDLEVILHRIAQRLAMWVARVEQKALLSRHVRDAFSFYRETVDRELTRLDPELLQKLNSAVERMLAGEPEARTHALTSCRRVISSLADTLYPPREGLTECSDGIKRELGPAQYKNRLTEYVSNECRKSVSRDLLMRLVEDTSYRITKLNDLASKGVHADISVHEVNQCVIQTYICVGDILALDKHTDPQS